MTSQIQYERHNRWRRRKCKRQDRWNPKVTTRGRSNIKISASAEVENFAAGLTGYSAETEFAEYR